MVTRYVARETELGRHKFIQIYDTETKSWPSLIGGKRVPSSFGSMEAAQAWADEQLNTEGEPNG